MNTNQGLASFLSFLKFMIIVSLTPSSESVCQCGDNHWTHWGGVCCCFASSTSTYSVYLPGHRLLSAHLLLLPLFVLLSHYCSIRARCLLDGFMKKDTPFARPVPSRATMMGPQRLTASLWWWYWVISAIKYESCIWYFSPLRSSASSRLGSIHHWLHPVRIATHNCCVFKKIENLNIFLYFIFWLSSSWKRPLIFMLENNCVQWCTLCSCISG